MTHATAGSSGQRPLDLERMLAKTGYIHEINGPLPMKGHSTCASYSNHFWYAKKRT